MRFGPWAPSQTNPFCCSAICRSPDENLEQSLLRTASVSTIQRAFRCALAKMGSNRLRMAAVDVDETGAIWAEILARFETDAVGGDAHDHAEYVSFLLPFSLQSVPMTINFHSPYPRKME